MTPINLAEQTADATALAAADVAKFQLMNEIRLANESAAMQAQIEATRAARSANMSKKRPANGEDGDADGDSDEGAGEDWTQQRANAIAKKKQANVPNLNTQMGAPSWDE